MTIAALALILLGAAVAASGPGPGTVAIAGTSMGAGRRSGVAFALGLVTGGQVWNASAALGLAAVMLTYAWLLEALRILGAAYLLWLAWRSARSALRPGRIEVSPRRPISARLAFARGLGLHLTNPNPILFFTSLYAVGLPEGTGPAGLALVAILIAVQSTTIFVLYALLFSTPRAAADYVRLRRIIEAGFAAVFGAAGVGLLTSRAT